MRNSLGISAGSAGVCGALVTTDDAGSQSVEYRTISADLDRHADLGDLALSAIGLMTTQVPDRRIEPDAIAVAYRTDRQAAAVRSAAKTQRQAIRLVPETVATLAYLRSTGLVDRYDCIALADLGASGLTVTVVDPADDTVTFRDRTSHVRGDGGADGTARIGSRVATFVADTMSRSDREPAAVVLVGGGGNIPDIGETLDAAFDCAVIVVPEPEAATAKGAALLAGSNARQQFPVVTGSGSRVSAPLIAAFVLGALIIGYGVQQMIPQSAENYSPANSLVETPSVSPTSTIDTAEPTIVHPDETRIPSVDPTPTSTFPVFPPTSELPEATTTTTSPSPTPTPTTTSPTPTSTTPETPETTKQPRPWIPPRWPEKPSWLPEDATPPRLPDFGDLEDFDNFSGFGDFGGFGDFDRPHGRPDGIPGFAPPRLLDRVPGFAEWSRPDGGPAVSPEPDSPKPEGQGSSQM
ncbi:exopolyphosphatase [Rhodococcus sp. ACT016]|uniref:exopolyphosphatase n=1 Tax=Rhodococcus sp. ACT016 TaxID=3134808 RepID=UPI003D2B4A88